ncbi:MAG: hypothetical protein C0478_16940 [Planctomyces sp.]|nr:hypothetical protein [Planctomyces sp.]
MRKVPKFILIAISFLAIASIGSFGFQFYRARLSEVVLKKIDRLALRPPPDKTELEWAVNIYWTHNLHCSASPQIHASLAKLWEIDRHLDNLLAGAPNQSDVDKLWIRYEKLSDAGRRYSQRYKSKRDAIATEIAEQGMEYFDVDSYLDLLERDRRVDPLDH